MALKNPRVFLDLFVNKKTKGRVTIELFSNVTPKTAENFRCLCTGEKGVGTTGKPLFYRNTFIHKIVPNVLIEGGDIVSKNGMSGESIYGYKFDDENFQLKHDQAGLLSMSNTGKNYNNSLFYITLAPTPFLDDKHVVFGKVLEGLDFLSRFSTIPVSDKFVPEVKIEIVDCGELPKE